MVEPTYIVKFPCKYITQMTKEQVHNLGCPVVTEFTWR